MKIRTRMIMSFAAIIVLSIVLAITSTTQLRAVADATTRMYNDPLQVVDNTWDIRRSLYAARVYTLEAVIEIDPTAIQASADASDEAAAEISGARENLKAIFANDATSERMDLMDEFTVSQTKTKEAREKVIGYAKQNMPDQAMQAYMDEYAPSFEESRALAIKLGDMARDDAAAFYNNSSKAANTSFLMVLILAGIQILAATLIAFSLTNGIIKPLNQLKEAAQHVADGEIDTKINYNAKNEMGDLADAFRSVITTLNLLNDRMKQLKTWATQGRIMERAADDTRVKGAYEDIVHGVNGIMETFGNHFNAIPVGVSIVDTTGSKLFSNPTADSHQLIDKDNIQTQKKDFADESGRVAGSLVITIDQTTIMEAQRESERQADNVAAQMKIAEKQAEYQAGEVEKLIAALDKLAKGQLNIAVSQAAYDEDTRAIHDNFHKIGNSLEASCTNIRGYIDELAETLGSIASKNLDVGIDREYLGDFAELKSSINNIANTLNEIFSEIGSATNQVQTGSQQVANSSQTLAQGASEQASAVEEISSTIAEVASQTRSNADNANKANEISVGAKVDAETGSKEMDEMVKAMEAIKEASKGIASIIKVIEDIAFQTNILALNAAVEAARAGEHGKGFAVVAEEVRTLAARSAAAAKETTEMIDNSLARVDVGSKIAGDTAAALSKIVSGVTDTVDIVATIAEASAQQATAISQIDNGIEQISKVTQSNTATAEESASASEEMAGQAQMLQSMISEFTLKGMKTSNRNSMTKLAPAARIPAPKEDNITIDLDDDFGKY